MSIIDNNLLLNYNTLKYLKSLGGLERMTIEGIVSQFQRCKTYQLSEEVSGYLYYIEKEPFYVSSEINDVKPDQRVSTRNPKFILFSAPGATGKSALAKHLAYSYNAIYWDLAKLKLGTNSFDGSILCGVGAKKYSEFIDDLDNSRVMLVIDAFDEAEIISGRKMLSGFIWDINKKISNDSTPSVILLARAETAQYIASFCAENAIALAHYEIGFFRETKAKAFIHKCIENERATTPADDTCIDAYYNAVKGNISDQESVSFLGYAPVLQAMAKHIKESTNQAVLLQELENKRDCISIISSIMESLLLREHSEKMVNALRQKCKDQHLAFSNWDTVYSAKEQLVRIVNYVLFGSVQFEDYPISGFPETLISDYQDMLLSFLPQHPFLRFIQNEKTGTVHYDFTGPAFRDYTLAELILDEHYSDMVDMYYEESKNNSHFPSQIFFDCYQKESGGVINSKHLQHVYDSYRAKATALEYPYLQCSEINDDDETTSHVAFFGLSQKGQRDNRAEIDFELRINDSTLSFTQLSNVTIEEPNIVVEIGAVNSETRITNSTIIARKIVWKTGDVTIEAFTPEKCLFVSLENAEGVNPSFEIVGNGDIKVSVPNINHYYRLIPYKYDFEDQTTVDINKFIHGMRAILIEFRAHRKDTLAKSAERIDYVVVGKSMLKKEILDYFKACGIVYQEAHLYKIDENKMQQKSIFFSGLARNDTEVLSLVYQDFLSWKTEK